ncbi:MOSC domain-containing protein [Ahrensia sp. R2A130]|uniref:MOSC domain-containing protein n=1 Tax=Ahrensia sp. R2A130 TaxID=744979 RepID=UPI0001E0D891|nr:MOSC domain-containing protein [Ahrensia sp. R2A130]EFL87934.1 mosc domain-containing protein [Ahrensia sp. R2A130]
MKTLAELTAQFPRSGRVEWIGVRPARREALIALKKTDVTENGLAQDRRTKPGKRAVTLIQYEHLAAIAALSGLDEIDPALLRRNIVVSGINLLALKDRAFTVGTVQLQGTGICAPCSRMEELLGAGGYNAMRGHGGITASVTVPGALVIGSAVEFVKPV